MSKSGRTEAEMIEGIKQMDAGRGVAKIARELGVSKHSIYAWKAKVRVSGREPGARS